MKKTFHQKPITIIGQEIKVGSKALDATLVDENLNEVKLLNDDTAYLLINVVPSLDTGVCSIQTRRINTKLAGIPNMKVITISCDLPFAQKRYCGAEGLDITTLSDHKYTDFGTKYGLLIEDLRLNARGIIILNPERIVVYTDYVQEMSNHPNYDQLFSFIEEVITQ